MNEIKELIEREDTMNRGWISVEHITPKLFKDVLCFGGGFYEIAHYNGDAFYDDERKAGGMHTLASIASSTFG